MVFGNVESLLDYWLRSRAARVLAKAGLFVLVYCDQLIADY